MAKIKIGKIPVYKGEYDNNTTYNRLNQVTYLGTTFQSIVDDNLGHPPAEKSEDGGEILYINTNYWDIIAKGIDNVEERTATDNSMGYKILKKNKSFAEQVIEENTIYEIRYDFTLTGDVTIPANCVLEFNGGNIKGNIKFNNTRIIANSDKCFTNIIATGNIANKSAFLSWFTDYQNAVDVCNNLSIGLCVDINITVSNPITIPSRFNIFGISKEVTITANGDINIFNLENQLYYTSIENLKLVGGSCGFYKEGSASIMGCVFKNIRFINQTNAGIKITDGGFGCNLLEELIFETSTTSGYNDAYIYITNNWYNNNDIKHCTFLGKSNKGCIHICSSQLDRNTITNCWFEKLYLESNDVGAIDISFNANSENKAYVVREFAIEDNYFEAINIFNSDIKGRAIIFNIAMSGASRYSHSSCIKKNTFTNLLKGCIVLKGGMFLNHIIEGNCGIGEEVAVVINDVASTIIMNQNTLFKGVCSETISSNTYTYNILPYYNTTYNVFTWKDITDTTDKSYKDHEYLENNKLYSNTIVNSIPGSTHEVTFEPTLRNTAIYQVYITPSSYETSYLAEIMVNFIAKKVELVKESFGRQSGWSYLTAVAYSFVDGDNPGIKITSTGNMTGPGDFTFRLKEISFI